MAAIVLEPIERPGFGTLGNNKILRLKTNSFQLKINDRAKTWYKYSVTITPISNRPTVLKSPIPLKKDLRRVWEELQDSEDRNDTRYFEGRIPAFDGRAAAYFAEPLQQQLSDIVVRLPIAQGGQSFQVSIVNPIPLNLDELRKYFGSTFLNLSQADANDCLAALNTIFHHTFAALYPSRKSTYYINDDSLLQGDKISLTGKPVTLGLDGGIELWRGFFQSVRPCPGTLSLNLDTTTGAFVKSGTMIQVLLGFIGRSSERDIQVQNLRSIDIIKFNRLIRGVALNINLGNSVPLKKGIKVKIGLSKGSARTETFTIRETGKTVSVEDFFKDTYQITLRHPDLPCVIVKQGVMYPAELCSIRPGTPSNKRLDDAQQQAATRFQTLAPRERLEAVTNVYRNTVKKLAEARFANEFAIEFPDPRGDANKVKGRLLAPPQIAYARSTATVQRGEWRMNQQDKFVLPANLPSYAIVAVGLRNAREGQAISEGFDGFIRECCRRGMNFASLPRDPAAIIYNKQRGESVKSAMDKAVQMGGNHYKQRPLMIFWVMPTKSESDYAEFKTLGVTMGIQTQSVVSNNVKKMASNLQFQLNLGMKVNTKLSGINFSFVPDTSSGAGPHVPGWFENHDTMIFGADLTHTQDKPSVAVVVGSMDKYAMKYEETISIQPLVEPVSAQGSAKKSETIVDMKEMVKKLLVRFTKVNQRPPPTSLLFYRDGVSDSEWAALLNLEIPAVEKAIAEFKATDPRLASWDPKLTFLIAVKRHSIKFFGNDARDGQGFSASQEGKNGNIPAGTVVDDVIVDPRVFDWYGAAHTGILGTTKPTRYVVMVDGQTPRMSADEIQGVTNSLCHAYQRCNRAVSIPAPVYYADIICTKVRDWMTELNDNSDTGSVQPDARSRALDLAEHIDRLKSKYNGRESMRGTLWWC